MPNWPIQPGMRWASQGFNTTTGQGVTLNTNASNNQKGSWVELVSSSAFDASGVLVEVQFASNNTRDWLLDIGVGSAGNEQPILSNLLCSVGTQVTHWGSVYFPVVIPEGSRIAARGQCNLSSNSIRLGVHLLERGFGLESGLYRATTYGVDTSTTRGTSIDPGGVVQTKGSWSQLSSSINATRQVVLLLGQQRNAVMTTCTWMLDVGIGSAGNEQVVLPDLWVTANANTDALNPTVIGPLPINLPAGVRLAARALNGDITDATDRLFDLTVVGIE